MELATSNVSEDNFPGILQKTLGYEGNDKLDPSGPSKYGILEKNYQSYLQEIGQPIKSIDKITLPEATEIYNKKFYKANSLHLLPARTAGVIFDWVVNSGAGNSIPSIQKIVGATPDGKVGPKTIKAINNYIATNGEDMLLENIINNRRDFIDSSRKQVVINQREGLHNRLNKLEKDYLRVNHGIRNLKQ